MKILLVNNFYYNRGGDCTYMFSLKELLEKKGHKVIIFSMYHPKNFESEYSKYFVSYIDYAEEMRNKSISSGMRVLLRSIYSIEAKKKMEQLINDEKPDIVHLNNIRHHLTPSILYPIKNSKIPIVWTLHDYQLICPNISFLADGRICERCKKIKYFWPPIVKCKKGSLLASLMASVEHTIQRIIKVYDLVDVFICPSQFLRNKFAEYDFKKEKLITLNSFTDIDCRNENDTKEEYCIFIGRISEEKGIKTLIDAVKNIESCSLKIVGDGPVLDKMISYVASHDIHNVAFLGHKSRKEVIEIIRNCQFLIIPSEWYEVTGLVIFEAFTCGKPVVGAKIGGIPEFIKDGETGFLFEPGNSDELSRKIRYLTDNHEKVREVGKACRAYIQHELNPEKHYNKLMEIYRVVLERNI